MDDSGSTPLSLFAAFAPLPRRHSHEGGDADSGHNAEMTAINIGGNALSLLSDGTQSKHEEIETFLNAHVRGNIQS
eukprot:6549254-Prymnesium_polylepis.1